jgi:hypothetical protein
LRLIGFDRIIDSDVAVPGAINAGGGDPDLTIRMISVKPPGPDQPLYRKKGASLLFSPPGVGTFNCRSDGIQICPGPASDPGKIVALLLATALPATLWMAGDFVLHASAVRLPGQDRALALAGPSGAGKSTVAAALVGCGADLVADDSVRLTRAGEIAAANGLPGGWFERNGSSTRFQPAPRGRSLRTCSLGAVVILSNAAGPDRPKRLDSAGAVEALLANRHRPRIPAALGLQGETLRFCSFLARTVPLYIWSQRQGPGAASSQMLDMLGRCSAGEDR